MRLGGLLQLGLEPSSKRAPARAVVPDRRLAHQRRARSQVGQPDVEPVLPRIFRLAHTAWWAPNRPDAETLAALARCSELDDPDCHFLSFSLCGFRLQPEGCEYPPAGLAADGASESACRV